MGGYREELVTIMELLAYLDPGSASALLAAVLAGIAGAGAAIRTYGRKMMFWKKDEPALERTTTSTTSASPNPAAASTAPQTPADSTDDKTSEQ